MKKLLRACAMGLVAALLWGAGLAEHWPATREIRCGEGRPGCLLLQTVMMGSFEGYEPGDFVGGRVLSAAYPRLCAITEEDIRHFTAEFGEDESAVRERWYVALGNALWADILSERMPEGGMKPAQRVLLLFLDPGSQPDAADQKAQIRAAMTDEALERIAGAAEAPIEFVRWLTGEDDWENRQDFAASADR